MAKNYDARRLATRQLFIEAARLREKEIDVPDFGIVRIRELNTDQRLKYMEYLELGPEDGKPHFSQAKQVVFNKFVISMGLITGSGDTAELMFPDGAMPEIRMDAAEKISQQILYLSNILPDPARKTTANPTTGEPLISGTVSPSNSA